MVSQNISEIASFAPLSARLTLLAMANHRLRLSSAVKSITGDLRHWIGADLRLKQKSAANA
jgi:hypothetical protein